jgi:hypothetical protein
VEKFTNFSTTLFIELYENNHVPGDPEHGCYIGLWFKD